MNCEASLVLRGQVQRVTGVQGAPQRLELAQVLLGPLQVVADEDAELLDLVVVAHEPRHVLGRVLARFGGEVAEPAVDLHRTRRCSSGEASMTSASRG